MRKFGSILAAVLVAASSQAGATTISFRSTVVDGQKADVVKDVKFQGDMRIREENFIRRTAGKVSRDRLRFRLRYGMTASLLNDITAGLEMASGTGEQVSTNQTFDNLSGQKAVWIDKVYLKWSPKLSEDGKVALSAGRMSNPFWRTTSSDVVWDDDFNPEGFAESAEWYLPALGGIYFANALQMVVDEDSTSKADQFMFGGQLGAEYKLPLESRLRFALAYYEWTNSRISDFGQAAAQDGNRRATGSNQLLNDFKVGEATAQYAFRAADLPVRLQGTLVRNTAARNREAAGAGIQARNQTAYQTGFILNEASDARSWEAGYFYKWSETDATVSDVADSDFGNGGTNRRGHIVWAAYNPKDWMQLKAKFFYTAVIAPGLAPGRDDINRLQLDYSLKF